MITQPDNNEMITNILINALKGENAHVNPLATLEGLDLKVAGAKVKNSPYTIWQIIKHINYWQERFIARLKEEFVPPAQTAAEGWNFSPEPDSEIELKSEIKKFTDNVNETIGFCRNNQESMKNPRGRNYPTGFDVIQGMASHISYHIGEIVFLRRILGSWPPPSGGDTW